MSESSFQHIKKDSPFIISMPHNGIEIPPAQADLMQNDALAVPDTDWFIKELYSFCNDLNVSQIIPRYSRYVIDLNRNIENQVMYPGQNETELCPLTQFNLQPIYKPGHEPRAEEIEKRIENYWQPYHQALKQQVQENLERHGVSVLLDAHSIATEVPRFFSNKLPDLNLGTNNGSSCDSELEKRLTLLPSTPFSFIANGRFKGGFITRHYGNPKENSHTVQLEISQDCYMQRGQKAFDPHYAESLVTYLKAFVGTLLEWSLDKSHSK